MRLLFTLVSLLFTGLLIGVVALVAVVALAQVVSLATLVPAVRQRG